MRRWAGCPAMVAALLVPGCTTGDRPAPAGCGSPVGNGPLPAWARAGFSGDGSGVPHVLGRGGAVLGVLFGAPLSAPPAPDRANKILWVSRLPPAPDDPLRITARRDGTTETVSREVAGGPGPSIIDLPRPGCWTFTLAWSGQTDTLDLTYRPPGTVEGAPQE